MRGGRKTDSFDYEYSVFFLSGGEQEKIIGPVDLVTRKSIRPRIKAQIESEAQYVEGLSALS
jgi:hypothetical protein